MSRYVPICAGGGLDIGSPGTALPEAPAVAAYKNGDRGEPLDRTCKGERMNLENLFNFYWQVFILKVAYNLLDKID